MKIFAFAVGHSMGVVIEQSDGSIALWGGKLQHSYASPKKYGPSDLLSIGKTAMPLGAAEVDHDMARALELALGEMMNGGK